jgi:S1-C subfamily serine protease
MNPARRRWAGAGLAMLGAKALGHATTARAATTATTATSAVAVDDRATASDRQAELVARSRAAVVPLGVWNPTESPRFAFRGSAFAIGDGRRIATCAHVLPPSTQVESRIAVFAETSPGQREARLARVLSVERSHDVAVLELEGPPLARALPLAEPDSIREGHAIVLMGYPIGGAFGFATVTHSGIVAAITTLAVPAANAQTLDPRAVSRMRDGNPEVLQLDAVAYPGNSGGPVIDVRNGRVVGLLSMAAVKNSRESALTSPTGISYAIPVRYLHDLLRTL